MRVDWSYCVVAFIFTFKLCLCQRRIVKGTRTHAQKRYMVYLIQSHEVTMAVSSWLCGGALVSPSQILTSAACIVEMENVYAIAGYMNYVNGMDIDKDNCTKITKRKVIKIRIPREHLQDFTNTTEWMSIDIGVATVDLPYDFEDISFRIYCSYIPAPIQINYSPILERVGTNVVALGWGRDRGSAPNDVTDRNAKSLQEVSLRIKSKEYCKLHFVGRNFPEMIDSYMICVHGKGVLDAEGLVLEDNLRHANRCSEFEELFGNKTNARKGQQCMGYEYNLSFRRPLVANETKEAGNVTQLDVKRNISNEETRKQYRRQGICQNDHGGPLITWIGNVEILIGVAVNSLYDSNYECVGPYLFISTSDVGSIIKCLLMSKDFTRSMCPTAAELKNYSIIERAVLWTRARDTDDEIDENSSILKMVKVEKDSVVVNISESLRTATEKLNTEIEDPLEVISL